MAYCDDCGLTDCYARGGPCRRWKPAAEPVNTIVSIAELDNLRNQLAACRAALRKYGQHQQPCLIPIFPEDMDGCRCGYDAALTAADGGEG